jgi:hypothetical protein
MQGGVGDTLGPLRLRSVIATTPDMTSNKDPGSGTAARITCKLTRLET